MNIINIVDMSKRNYNHIKKPKSPLFTPHLFNIIGEQKYNGSFVALVTPSNVNFVGSGNETVLMRLIKNSYPFEFITNVVDLMTNRNIILKDNTSNTALDYCLNDIAKNDKNDLELLSLRLLNKKCDFKIDNLLGLIKNPSKEQVMKNILGCIIQNKSRNHALYEQLILNITKENYKYFLKLGTEIQNLKQDDEKLSYKFLDIHNDNPSQVLNDIIKINGHATLKYFMHNKLYSYHGYKFDFRNADIISFLISTKYLEDDHFRIIMKLSKSQESKEEIIFNNLISSNVRFLFIISLDYDSFSKMLENKQIKKEELIISLLPEITTVTMTQFEKCGSFELSDDCMRKLFEKLGKISLADVYSYRVTIFNCGLIKDFTNKCVADKAYDGSSVPKMLDFFSSNVVDTKLVKSLVDLLPLNTPESGYNNIALPHRYHTRYINIEPELLSSLILKMSLITSFIENINHFDCDFETHKILLKSDLTEEIIKNYYTKLLNCLASKKRWETLKYIKTTFPEIIKNCDHTQMINYIEYDFENIGAIMMVTFDAETRIFTSANFMGHLTLFEKLMDLLISTNNDKLIPLIEQSFSEIKDYGNLKCINVQEHIARGRVPEYIIKKLLSNTQDLLRLLYGGYDQKTVEIDAMDPLGSVVSYIQQPEYMNRYWKIKYMKQNGIDAGGLIRDFYYILGDEIKKHMNVMDNYYFLSEKNKDDTELWFRIGLMLGKMFVIERLPCGINLHPYLLYRITHPEFESTKTITFEDDWYDDIDFIKNVGRIAHYETEELEIYNMSVTHDGSDAVTMSNKLEHCTKILLDNYEDRFQPGLGEFINGFWGYGDAMLLKYIDTKFVGKKICGSLEYKIFGNENNSLQQSSGINLDNTYHKGLFNALEKVNKEDNEKLQKLFRFWLGSPYLDLAKYHPRIAYGNKKQVFEAHTCSLELVVPNPNKIPQGIADNEEKSTEFMIEVLNATIYNQELADKHNLHTQYG